MNKKLLFFFCIVVLLCSSCIPYNLFGSENTLEDISAPKIEEAPLQGTWKIKKIVPIKSDGTSEESESAIGDELYISTKLFRFSDYITLTPSYKGVRLNIQDFLLKNYSRYRESIGLNNTQYDVIIISDEEQGLYHNIIKLNSKEIIFPYKGYFLFFEKISEKIDSAVIQQSDEILSKKKETVITKEYQKEPISMLIGVRNNSTKGTEFTSADYSTYLVYWNGHQETKPLVAKSSQLFVPRKSGFWIIGNEGYHKNEIFVDRLFAHPVESNLEQEGVFVENSLLKNITYVGQSYISTVNKYTLSINKEMKMGLYNLNELDYFQSLDIQEFAGKAGLNALEDVLSKAENDIGNLGINSSDMIFPKSDEIGIIHQQGVWNFNTIVQANGNQGQIFEEYKVNLIPRLKFFNTNQNLIPWKEIKNYDPTAIDAAVSFSGEFVLIQNPRYFSLRSIKNGKILDNSGLQIHIEGTEKIIMIEFGLGNYSDYWKTEFLKQRDVQEIKD